MSSVVNPQQLLPGCLRRKMAKEMVQQAGGKQIIRDRRDTVGRFRMLSAHVVQHAIGMIN